MIVKMDTTAQTKTPSPIPLPITTHWQMTQPGLHKANLLSSCLERDPLTVCPDTPAHSHLGSHPNPYHSNHMRGPMLFH